jgi:hypothetical protein
VLPPLLFFLRLAQRPTRTGTRGPSRKPSRDAACPREFRCEQGGGGE